MNEHAASPTSVKGERSGWLFALLAIVLAVALYAPTLSRGLSNYDDPWLIGDNLLLQQPSLRALEIIIADLSPTTRFQLGAEYLPVRDLSVMIDFWIWGDWYPGHHITNLLLYVAAIAAWFGALVRFGLDPRLAGLAIVLWAVHPTHAESVAWLTERKGLLAIAWTGVTALAYARFRAGGRARWLACAAVATLFAVWSKAPAAFAIACLAPIDVLAPVPRTSGRRSLAGLATIVLVAALAFVPVLQTAMTLDVVASAAHEPTGYVSTVLGMHGHFVQLAAMVAPNAVSYPIQTDGPTVVQVVLGAVGLVAALVMLVGLGRAWRPPAALRIASLIWLAGWFPASRIAFPLKAGLASDRYLLFPTLGFAVLLAWLLLRIPSARARYALVAAIVLAGSLRALDAQANWRDDETLWARAIASNPRDGAAWSSYAEAVERRDPLHAAEVVARGLGYTRSPRLLYRKALLVVSYGKRPHALQAMKEAAEAGEPRAMASLALLLVEDKRASEGVEWARRAVATAPMYARGYRNLGVAALAVGEPMEAYVAFERALALWPHDPVNHYNLGLALIELQRFEEARVHLRACLGSPSVDARARSLLDQLPQ